MLSRKNIFMSLYLNYFSVSFFFGSTLVIPIPPTCHKTTKWKKKKKMEFSFLHPNKRENTKWNNSMWKIHCSTCFVDFSLRVQFSLLLFLVVGAFFIHIFLFFRSLFLYILFLVIMCIHISITITFRLNLWSPHWEWERNSVYYAFNKNKINKQKNNKTE